MTFTRRYYVLLAISGVLALITQIPGVLLLAAVMFILPGLVLLAGSNAFIYLLALLPVLWVLTATRRQWLLLAPALLPATALAFLPKEYSDRVYEQFEAALVRQDFTRPTTLTPSTVAILGEPWERGCTVLCEKLLFNGHAQSVTIGSTRFRLETRAKCPEVTDGNRRLLMQAASGRCLLDETASDSANAADVVVQVTDLRRESEIGRMRVSEENRLAPFTVDKVVRYEIHEAGVLMERRTHVTAQTIGAPLLISMASVQGSLNGFPSIARVKHETHSETIEAMLQRRYGWPLVDAVPADGGSFYANEAPVDMNVFDVVLARSQASGDEVSEADNYALAQGVRQITAKPVLEEADIASMRAVMRLTNMRMYGEFTEETREWRPEYATLIPDAVARVEYAYVEGDGFAANMFSFLAGAPREVVRPYAARIDAALAGPQGNRGGKLFRVLHEISPDPAPVLIPWTRIPDGDEIFRSDLLEGALVGLCRAAQPGREDIAQAFRDFLRISFSRNTPRYQSWAAIAGLARTSGIEEVRRVTTYSDAQRRENIRLPLRAAMEKPWPASCARY